MTFRLSLGFWEEKLNLSPARMPEAQFFRARLSTPGFNRNTYMLLHKKGLLKLTVKGSKLLPHGVMCIILGIELELNSSRPSAHKVELHYASLGMEKYWSLSTVR